MAEKTNPRLLFCALLIMGVTGGIYLQDRLAEDSGKASLHASEIATLEDEFQTAKFRLETNPEGPKPALTMGLKSSLIPTTGSRLAELLTEKESKAGAAMSRIEFSSQSWEGFPTTVAFTRLPKLNSFLVLEKVHEPLKASAALAGGRDPLFKKLELILSALVGLGIFIAGFFPSRKKVQAENHEPVAASVTPPPSPLSRTPVTASTPREASIEKSLTEASYRATRLPSLFFRYLPREGILKLSTESGIKGASKIHLGGMSFALSAETLREIYAAEARKERRDLSDQPALKQILRSQYGITHFDAWPVLETPSLRAQKILGVLIVARATSAYLFEKKERSPGLGSFKNETRG